MNKTLRLIILILLLVALFYAVWYKKRALVESVKDINFRGPIETPKVVGPKGPPPS